MSYTDNVEANFISFTEQLFDKSLNKEAFAPTVRAVRNVLVIGIPTVALLVAAVSPVAVGILAVVVAAWMSHAFWYGYTASAKFADFLLEEEMKKNA